jgi:hypothetical protein
LVEHVVGIACGLQLLTQLGDTDERFRSHD